MLDVINQDSQAYQTAFQDSFADMQDQPQPGVDWLEAIVYPQKMKLSLHCPDLTRCLSTPIPQSATSMSLAQD